MDPFLSLWSLEFESYKCLLLLATEYMVICYSSNGKLIRLKRQISLQRKHSRALGRFQWLKSCLQCVGLILTTASTPQRQATGLSIVKASPQLSWVIGPLQRGQSPLSSFHRSLWSAFLSAEKSCFPYRHVPTL